MSPERFARRVDELMEELDLTVEQAIARAASEPHPDPYIVARDRAMGYRDRAGIDSRANSALLRIDRISNDVSMPPAVRLAMVAEIIAAEPILTDNSPAAYSVRSETLTYKAGA